MVVDAYARSLAVAFLRTSPRLITARDMTPTDECLILAKPQTFMNRSGSAVLDLISESGAEISDLLVVHDDLDLGLGRLRIRSRGGHGGNRGIQSVIASVKSQNFYRLRVGIGRPPASQTANAYVLSAFLSEEKPVIKEVIERAVQALDCFFRYGPETAMNRFNQ